MTRVLSELLNAPEPAFRFELRQLEQATGGPSHDIRLSAEVHQSTLAKLRELGLDPHDTTPEELYKALEARVVEDDRRLERALRTRAATYVSAEGDVMQGILHALKEADVPKNCFALKSTSLKKMLKKQPPKRTMKQLGYRSMDSMLKHEAPASLLAAALLFESRSWRRSLHEQYRKLAASDFESRRITLMLPEGRRWQELAETVVAQKRHNIITLKELGAIVLLPLPASRPPAAVTTTLLLALHALNEVRSSGTFLKLCQVRPDFGRIVQAVVAGEPHLNAELLDRPVAWQLIQRYYARLGERFREELFEPHIQLDDLSWHNVEKLLGQIDPTLTFWEGTAFAGLRGERRPVSMNLMDVALNCCNRLPYAQRVTHYFQSSLWHELMLRYLKHDTVEQTVLSQLQPQLEAESVTD